MLPCQDGFHLLFDLQLVRTFNSHPFFFALSDDEGDKNVKMAYLSMKNSSLPSLHKGFSS